MPRRLSPLLLAVLVALLAPAAAHAAWFPGEALDGPSADVVAVDDLDIARDGTGAVVWRRVVDGTPHVFVSRLAGGAWLEHLQAHGDGVRADDAALARVAAGAEILDVDGIPQLETAEKLLPAFGEPALEQRRLVAGLDHAAGGMDRLRLLEDRPASHRDEEFFGEFQGPEK